MEALLARHGGQISGVTSCFDRVVIMGSLLDVCYPEGMAAHLSAHDVRLFDFTKWAEPLRNQIRENAETLATQEGLEIDFIRRKNFRKEERVKEIVAARGDHPGLVHIFSAMEPCASFRPWHDKQTHRTTLKSRQAQCLHYYFYFIDKDLGLCYLRVPTWAPFRLQFYFNGHNWLARRLEKRGIDFTLLDNAFIEISDYDEAQRISDRYLAFLSQLDEPKSGLRQLDKISRPVRRNQRSHRGFNLFHGDDLELFVAIARGEHCISGFRNRDLQRPLGRNGGQVSRLLKRLRVHGLIKKAGRTYKYYLTRLGRSVVACALRLREETVVPALANT